MGQSIKDVEIFEVGNWKDSEFTEAHLDEMVKAFDVFGFMPPLKLGHDENQKLLQRDGMPAAGWVERIYRVGRKLVADFKDIPDIVASAIKRGAYRQISSEVYFNFPSPDGTTTFSRVLRAVALLGADNPAVSTLKPIDPLALFKDNGTEYKVFNMDIKKQEIHLPELLIFADEGIRFVIGRLKGEDKTTTQSVSFDKNKWDESQAKKWLNDHNMRSDKVDVTENTIRFRQRDPDDFDKLRTITPGSENATDHGKDEEEKKKMKNNFEKKEKKMADKVEKKELDIEAVMKRMTDDFNQKLENQKKDFVKSLSDKDDQVKSLAIKLTDAETERDNEKISMNVDGWVKDGILKPANKSAVYTLLTNLTNAKTKTVKFADSENKPVETNVYDLAVKIFAGMEKTVEFGETAGNSKELSRDTNPSDEVNRKTKEYMSENKMEAEKYADALKIVLTDDPELKARYTAR
ncbi:MAG TPA: hypothetical protein ENH82_19555 [bacterium]|nr:hypothetical protein [bacterium]